MDSSFSKPTEIILLKKKILISQNNKIGYAGEIWDSAYSLSRLMLSKRSQKILKNKVILEVGSGTGICAIFTAMTGVKKVFMTDREQVLELLHLNYSLNKEKITDCNVITTTLDWNFPPNFKNIDEKIDFIIASDIIYHGVNFSNILNLFKYFSILYQPEILLSYTDRGNSSAIDFFEFLENDKSWKLKKLNLKTLEEEDDEFISESNRTVIFSIKYIIN